MSNNQSRYITVFYPTFNGEKYVKESIEATLKQQLPDGFELEVLVTDSGSSDRTLEILENFGSRITLNQIPNEEYGHGKTRQAAAEQAKGEFILFLTQDATPAHDRWLMSMIEPFFIGDRIGCVFGAQVPRTDAVPTIKREVTIAFSALGERNAIMIHRANSLVDGKPTNGMSSFFSDANSAVRRDLLLGEVPFRDLKYSEDQALAEDMQNKGYVKAYAPQGEVWHSNEYTARQYFYRKFDEFIGLQESVGMHLRTSLKSLLLGWIRPTLADYRFIVLDRSYGHRLKLKGFVVSPLYNIASKAGMYYAAKYLDDPEARKRISLEHRLKD